MGTYTSLEGGFQGENLPQVHKAIDYLIGNTNHLLKYKQKDSEYINLKNNEILETSHPSPLSANRGFFGCKHFSKINNILKQEGVSEIDWQLK